MKIKINDIEVLSFTEDEIEVFKSGCTCPAEWVAGKAFNPNCSMGGGIITIIQNELKAHAKKLVEHAKAQGWYGESIPTDDIQAARIATQHPDYKSFKTQLIEGQIVDCESFLVTINGYIADYTAKYEEALAVSSLEGATQGQIDLTASLLAALQLEQSNAAEMQTKINELQAQLGS